MINYHVFKILGTMIELLALIVSRGSAPRSMIILAANEKVYKQLLLFY